MIRQLIVLFFSFSLLIGSFANANEITLYTQRHYDSDKALIAQFTEKTGIKVNVVQAGADELIERLSAEGDNSPADMFMTVDAGRLERAKTAGLLQPLDSDLLKQRIPVSFRDPEGHWFGFSMRARILAYAKERVSADELESYEALANAEWRGRILVRSSSNIYNQSLMASIIAEHGVIGARDWANAISDNMARPPQGSDRDQMRAVAAGLGDVAIVNTYYLGLLLNSTDPKDRSVGESLAIFFPNQERRGTHVNVSGAGITKSSKNKENAVKFLEFLISDGAQATFPAATHEYPVAKGVEWSELQKSWGEFKVDPLYLGVLGDLNEAAIRVFNESDWR